MTQSQNVKTLYSFLDNVASRNVQDSHKIIPISVIYEIIPTSVIHSPNAADNTILALVNFSTEATHAIFMIAFSVTQVSFNSSFYAIT